MGVFDMLKRPDELNTHNNERGQTHVIDLQLTCRKTGVLVTLRRPDQLFIHNKE